MAGRSSDLGFWLRVILSATIVVLFSHLVTVAASTQSGGAKPQQKAAESMLSSLQFRNAGIVRSDMRFEYIDQPLEYAEDVDYWNVTRRAKYLYLFKGGEKLDPPTGMRSSVPLGGLGAGTVELRADGSFRDWNIFNNSPAGGNKIQIDDTFFALWVKSQGSSAQARALRTHPPGHLRGIGQIEYSGAFPVSRLKFTDPALPVDVTLYSYCEFHPHDAKASAAPAVIFTFELKNPTRQAIDVSLLLNLRKFTDGQLEPSHPLTFASAGNSPTSGTIAVTAEGEGSSVTTAASTGIASVWAAFSKNGTLPGAAGTPGIPRYGALAIKASIGPHETKRISYVLAWYLPNRPFKSAVPGNYYTRLYSSADDVAAQVLGRIPATCEAIRAWQQTMFQNSLPAWLINGVATMYKTGMWLEDGRWRQWESFSCSGLDPVHIDFYRILPYAFFFPELQKNLLATHARLQQDDGFIHEQLSQGCFSVDSQLDDAGGRVMGDSATGFLLEAWQIYSWTGDRAFLDSIWPNIRRAAAWQVQRSERFGLPEKLENTYDWWQFGDKDLVSYNAFLHLSAMLAAEKIAQVEDASDLAQKYRSAFERGQNNIDTHFWTGNYFRSWWLDGKPYPDALHADTLYGQLWAYLLDLGPLVDQAKMKSHLESESQLSGSPYGLKVMRRAHPDHPENEDAVPLPGRSVPIAVDNMVWQAGSLDWATLDLFLGGDVDQALGEAAKVVHDWQDRMRDQWDYTDTVAPWDGYLWCNSHYARQLISWSIPLALSGQRYYAPEARLSFDPKLPAPAMLPFFTPTAAGRLQLLDAGRYRLVVDSGHLNLRELRVGKTVLKEEISLEAGQSVGPGTE